MNVKLADIESLTEQITTTSHVGRSNRLITQRCHVFDAIDADPERLGLLRALLAHPRPSVRLAAAWHCGWRQLVPAEAEHAVTELAEQPGEIGHSARRWLESRERMAGYRWEAPRPKTLSYEPRPAGRSRAAATELIARSVARERARALVPLLRRAIRLWPRARDDDPRASCFGGLPALPPRYAWPVFEGEPLLFLGQVNCGDLRAAVGDSPLPKVGLLQFYGDHDEVNGCGPMGSGAVLYFADSNALQAAPAPIRDFLELPRCGLDFYETVELPDPLSDVIGGLRLSPVEEGDYRKLSAELAALGGAGPQDDRASKLLGWPNLVQRDLGDDCGAPNGGDALLLQIGWYHDGARRQYWGPGGLVYFLLDERALTKARFDLAAMEMQCT